MALKATFEIEGSNVEYDVIECEYEFTQEIDSNGRPSESPKGGLINITIVAPDDTDLIFHEWMRDKFASKEGVITFIVNNNHVESTRYVGFRDAYCVGLSENFNKENDSQMIMKLTISAGVIKFGDNCEFHLF